MHELYNNTDSGLKELFPHFSASLAQARAQFTFKSDTRGPDGGYVHSELPEGSIIPIGPIKSKIRTPLITVISCCLKRLFLPFLSMS